MEKNEALSFAKQEVKTLDNYLDSVDYENALSDAIRETGWSFPITSDFRAYWIRARMKKVCRRQAVQIRPWSSP